MRVEFVSFLPGKKGKGWDFELLPQISFGEMNDGVSMYGYFMISWLFFSIIWTKN